MANSSKKGKSIGRYEVVEKLWDGCFSQTWVGKTSQNAKVAIQEITDDLLKKELQAHPMIDTYNLSSPDIARLLAVEQDSSSLVWEYLTGRRLQTYIKELRSIKQNIAVYIARKLLEVLSYTSSQGCVHGALRPTRVIISPDKKVMITNFGVGFAEQQILSNLIQEGKDVKKYQRILSYFPQEVLEDQLFEDPKSDIYSVGIILAEMIIGKCVDRKDIASKLHTKKIAPKLISVILKATSDFEERYLHPDEMYRDLTQLLKASNQVEKIYVPPPSINIKSIAMEAIPADSEEYRVYQAEVISAKQAIDAEVVVAEPVEYDENQESKIHKKIGKKLPEVKETDGLKKTVRLDSQALLLFSTIDKKILDPLEKDSIWPKVFIKFFLATCFIFSFLLFITVLSIETAQKFTESIWILSPLYTIMQWPNIIQFFAKMIIGIGGIIILFLPIINQEKDALRHRFFMIILTVFLFYYLFLEFLVCRI